MRTVYRLGQGLRALAAQLLPVRIDTEAAAAHLSPPLFALFMRLKRSEQLHALRVLRAVQRHADPAPPALAAAALLHDVGKTCYPVSLAGKTLPVLVRAAAPALAQRLSAGDPRHPLVRPFVVYVHHPRWSGDLLTAAGADADTVWLAAHHADSPAQWRDHPLYPLLIRLQHADDTH
ncbi:MAG: hypothetical protein SF162_08400 [bacterium]|nr:hypothetical protein [bacterium]